MTIRYIVQRIAGPSKGTILHWNLPLGDVEIVESLGTNWLRGTIAPELLLLYGSDNRPILDKWAVAIWAEQDGQIYGGGILVNSTITGPSRTLECMGYAGYPYGIPYGGEYSGVNADPADIIMAMWTYIQSIPESNFGMTVIANPTPVRLGTPPEDVAFQTGAGTDVAFVAGPWKLNWWEAPDLGTTFDTLCKDSPFEKKESHYWNAAGTQIMHSLEYRYPRMGRRRSDLRFVYGENVIVIPELPEEGMYFANEVWGLGAGTGRTMIRAISATSDYHLRRVHVLTDNAEKSKTRMAVKTQAALTRHRKTSTLSEITVIDHENARINSWTPGDEIFVKADYGHAVLEIWCRIIESTIRPERANEVVLTLEGLRE